MWSLANPKGVDVCGELDFAPFAPTNQKDKTVRVNFPEVSFLRRSFEVFPRNFDILRFNTYTF